MILTRINGTKKFIKCLKQSINGMQNLELYFHGQKYVLIEFIYLLANFWLGCSNQEVTRLNIYVHMYVCYSKVGPDLGNAIISRPGSRNGCAIIKTKTEIRGSTEISLGKKKAIDDTSFFILHICHLSQ